MAESSSVTEHTQALTLQGSCPADNGEYVNGVTFPDKMADDELLQGVTKETRNGDVYKHEAVGGFVLDYDKKADDGIYPTDDQKVPSAFCDEDTFMGDVPSCPVPREPEIPLGSDATSFPQQCEDFVGSNIDDSFSPFNSEMSSYSQTGSHESFPAFGGEREMDPTPEALPDPVPPMGQENVLIDFCEDSDPPADVKCDNTNPFVDLSPGEMTPSDPYSDVEPNNGNNKNTEQIVQSPLRHDAPEFSPQGHSNAEFSPLRHDAPEFLPREPQQAAVFDQSPHIGGLDGMERHSLSQSDTFDKPNEQVQDVIDSFDKCKENMPVPMEDQSVPAINITSDQGEDDEDYSGEEDYSESESNSQAENDEIIEDDYTDSEDTENIQDSDDVSGGPGEGRPVLGDGIVHPAFDQGSVKPAFSENEFQFQQQGLACDITAGHVELMPSVGAEPPVVGGITEGKGEQANEMGSSQMDMAQDSTERQPVGTGELQRDTICKSETFTIESDSDMEERSITPEQESMKTTRNNVMSGQDDSQSVQAHSGASPPFNYSQMDSSFNQQTVEPVFNQSQMEPAFNQGQMEPAFNQGQMEPAFNQGQMEPAFNQGQMEPAFNQGQMEPAFNQGQMEPAFNQGQMEHAFNQGQMEPAFNQDQMEPVFNQGQMEPAFNQEQMEPALNQGQMEPALNQGQEGPAFSQGQMEPAFNQEQMEPIKNQMQNEQNVLASHSETSPVEFHGDNMFTNQPVLQQEPEHKQQIAFQDEHDFPQQTDFQNDMVPSEGFTEDPVFSPEDTSKMELSPNKCHKQPDCREDVATPSEVLLENTPEQKYQLEESGVEHDQPVPLMSPCQQLEDAGFSQVFSQVVDDSFMDSENTQTNAETLVEPNTQKHAYEDEKGDADEDGDEDMFPDDQYSSSGEEKEEEDEGLLSHQPKPADATQLPSSEATSAYQKEEKASSEERSASLQEQKLTSEERSVSPEECDRNEYSESNAVEKGSGLSESQDKLVSEERSLSPEYHTLNDQKKIEAQGTYEEHTAPQSFEKKAPSLVPEMAAREIDQSTVDQTYGVTPATFQGSELERISSPDQAQSPVTVDTDRDTHTSGRNSEDFEYEQGEDSLTAEGGSDSDQDLPEQFDEDVDVQPNITDDSLADQPVPKETGLKEINEEQERLEAGSDMKESGMGESIITADSQETDDQSPSEIPRQMMEDYGDTERSLTSSMECQTYEDDAGVSPVKMAASLMEGSMVLKEGETDNVASSLSQSVPTESALEEYSKDRMEDEEIENIRHQLSPEILEVEPKSAHLAPQLRVSEDINVGEDVQKVYAAEEKVVSPSPVAEAPVPPTADQQVVVQEPTTAVQHASAPDKGTKKTDEKQDKFADKMEGATTKNVVKKIAEPTVKKSQVTEKIDKKEAKPKKQEKPITKTPQKPLRKPKQRTPPKSDDSKIPSPTKTEGGITKSTTRTLRSSVPSKTAPPKSLSVKQNTEKPPFDTSFPRAVSASRQRILPLAQTPTTPSPTKAPSKKIPTRTQSKEATQLFLERMSRPRCRTPKKDGSDSGVEEDKTPRATSATSQRKKYGIDAKNENYKPGGGNVKITDQKVTVKHVGSRIDARSKTPTGSPRKEATPKAKPTTPKGSTPDTKHVQSKIDSLKNSTHSPGGGNVKISHQKVDYSTVQGKIGSKANLDHRPKGGDKKILSKKLEWKAESRVGSLDNAKHAPGGGKVKIETAKLDFKEKATSKVGSKDNMDHKAGGGNKKIETKKLDFKEKASSKVGSKDNVAHKPGGGDKKIESHKLTFKESAKPATDTGTGHVVSSPPCLSPSLKSPRPDSEISQDSLPQQATSPDNIDSSVPAQ